MPRYAAFLRAVNVGGRVVKMDALRRAFEEAGFTNVTTFIASGNVLFDARVNDASRLEARIETLLAQAFGYPVGTFVRTIPELKAIAAHDPYGTSPGTTTHICFLKEAPSAAEKKTLLSLRDADNDFAFQGREIYWLIRGLMSVAGVSGGKALEKALGRKDVTVRNANTVRKLAAKC